MDFGELLYAAQRNDYNKKEVKCYKTKFEPPKKEQKAQKTLSTNIQKFLARKEEEERQKQEEANKKRDELLSLRAQDGKAKKRVAAMLKRTKAANKAAIADAVDNDNTAVTISGLAAQPDEDDYGYVSQEASAFYDKLLQKYHSTPSEQPLFSKRLQPKTDARELSNTKDRVRMALLKQEEEEMMPHKRKRKTKEEKLKEQGGGEQDPEEQDGYEESESSPPPPVEKPKPKRPPAPPPLDFHQLLKIAEKKQYEPIKIEPKVKLDEDERPMTKKQRAEYMKEQEWRMRKEGKLPPLSSDASSRPSNNRPQGGSRPTADQGFKRPAEPSKGPRPTVDRDSQVPNRSQQSADRPRPGNMAAVKSKPQNTSRPAGEGYKERNHVENGYKDRSRTVGGGYADRNRNIEEKSRPPEINKHRSENVQREHARPLEDTFREKRQSEMNYKEKYRSSERGQLSSKPRDKDWDNEMQREAVGGERKEASIPRVPKGEVQSSTSSFNGSKNFKKFQGNADGKVGKARNMADLFGDDESEPVVKTKNIPSHSASDQRRSVSSANSKSSDYAKKLQESIAAKLEERERARLSSSKVQKHDSGPSPAKFPKLQSSHDSRSKLQTSDDSRGPKLQPRPSTGDVPRKEVGNVRPALKATTTHRASEPSTPKSQPRTSNEMATKANKAPMSSKDVKSRQFPSGNSKPRPLPPEDAKPRLFPSGDSKSRPFPSGAPKPRPFPPGDAKPRQLPPGDTRPRQLPPGDMKPRQFPPADSKPRQLPSGDTKPRQFPPGDTRPRQFPPGAMKPRQFPPPDVKSRQFPPPDVRRKQFPPADMRRKPKPPVKRRIEDSDEDYDSELDDFIDDGPQEDDMDYSKHIKEIFGYDKSRYADVDDGDECMESSFSQQLKEEFVSTKLGIMEDLEDIRKEKEMEKRKKMKTKRK